MLSVYCLFNMDLDLGSLFKHILDYVSIVIYLLYKELRRKKKTGFHMRIIEYLVYPDKMRQKSQFIPAG